MKQLECCNQGPRAFSLRSLAVVKMLSRRLGSFGLEVFCAKHSTSEGLITMNMAINEMMICLPFNGRDDALSMQKAVSACLHYCITAQSHVL